MEVALDASSLAGPTDSFGRTVGALARGLAAVGHQPLLVADDPGALALEGVPGVALRRTEALANAACFWSPHIELPGGIDLPMIATVHDVQPLLPDGRSALHRMFRGRRFRARARRCARVARLIATPTAYSQASVERHLPEMAGRVRVVGQSVDPRMAAPEITELAPMHERMGVPMGGGVCVCALRRHKNAEGLVAAYARLPADLRRMHPLVFAGPDDRGRPRVIEAARKAGLAAGEIFLLGRRSDAEIRSLYAGAAVFAYPSLLEGFGLPPLEAMACGAPVVSSGRAALPEVLGDAALLVDPTDARAFAQALERVLTDRELATRLSAGGKARAARFDDETLGRAASAVLEEICCFGREP